MVDLATELKQHLTFYHQQPISLISTYVRYKDTKINLQVIIFLIYYIFGF